MQQMLNKHLEFFEMCFFLRVGDTGILLAHAWAGSWAGYCRILQDIAGYCTDTAHK
jgi:hypothetical protein